MTVEVACPDCALPKTVWVPLGAERTLLVESSALAEDDYEDGVAG